MKISATTALVLLSVLLLSACNGQPDSGSSTGKQDGEHIWKGKTDTLQRAKEVEGMVQQQFDRQQRQLEQQGR